MTQTLTTLNDDDRDRGVDALIMTATFPATFHNLDGSTKVQTLPSVLQYSDCIKDRKGSWKVRRWPPLPAATSTTTISTSAELMTSTCRLGAKKEILLLSRSAAQQELADNHEVGFCFAVSTELEITCARSSFLSNRVNSSCRRDDCL